MMKTKTPYIFFLLLSCQGPWSYWPDDPEEYVGIWINAYVVSGRHVQNVCLEKMHKLDEVRMPGFAFYESAEIRIKGVFNGKDTAFYLYPASGNPNCFVNFSAGLVADAGQNYELDASITWDSTGKKVVSNFHAKTYIPRKFKIQRAYDLLGQQYSSGDTILFFPPPMDMKSNYFIPEYSDDVSGVRVTMSFAEDVYWGKNSIHELVEQFTGKTDTANFAQFGDRRPVYTARNQQMMGSGKDIDSIPVIGMLFPAIGAVKIFFYATTPDYIKYFDTHINGNDDSRIKAVYNIQGGAGIFAGMLVDTFVVNLDSAQNVELFQNKFAQDFFCNEMDEDTNVPNWVLKRECIDVWDKKNWHAIHCKSGTVCFTPPQPAWYDVNSDELKAIMTKEELATWCEHRDFPIDRYPLCGSMLVYYSKTGKKSTILTREVKKWCEEHPNDAEC